MSESAECSPDEYEFSLVLEMALSVARNAHLKQIEKRNPALVKEIRRRLENLQGEMNV